MNYIKNPILKGFNPDPSIIQVGEYFYIATSTFEWYPGVQIHQSKDLKNWKLVKRPLERDSQLNMMGEDNSLGIWAPCLSYSDGIFYLVYTDTKINGIPNNYVVTTKDILGDWSDPVYLNSRGFDPSFFHDLDGRIYYLVMYYDHIPWSKLVQLNGARTTNHSVDEMLKQYQRMNKERPLFKGILLQEYDNKSHSLIGPIHKIFDKALGVTEGPHLYKHEDYYHLLVAEGGTSFEHAVTMARSKSLLGPYEVHPDNPVLTARDKECLIQKSGHADLLELANGDVYMVHLGSRPIKAKHGSVLGRETSIQKMRWYEDGWLRLDKNGNTPEEYIIAPNLPEHKWPIEMHRDDFNSAELNIHFQWLRGAISKEIYSLSDRPGYLRLKGKDFIFSKYKLALIARRQQDFVYTATTKMEFDPCEVNQMAGLVVMYHNELFYYLYMGYDEKIGPFISIMKNIQDDFNLFVVTPVPIKTQLVFLKAKVNYDILQFYYSLNEDNWLPLGGPMDMSVLSDEFSGGFTGAFVGLTCQDPADNKRYADFDYFDYIEGV